MVKALLITHNMEPYHKNGGTICVENHIHQLTKINGLSLSIAALITAPINKNWVDENGNLDLWPKDKICDEVRHFLLSYNKKTSNNVKLFGFPFEAYVDELSEAQIKLNEWCETFDLIIVEHVFTALFVQKIFKKNIPIITVTHNPEYKMYADHINFGLVKLKSPLDYLSIERLRLFERDVYCSSTKVVVLSHSDIPEFDNGVVITPFLDNKLRQWEISDSKQICFVGRKDHYPNFYAMDWISKIAKFTPEVEYIIFGCDKDGAKESWIQSNIKFMGESTSKIIEDTICSSMCSIAPIENTYGYKFKIAEAMSYGAPVLLSEQANMCVDYINSKYVLKLNNIEYSSNIINSLLQKSNLKRLSSLQKLQHSEFMKIHKFDWENLINELI